MALQGESESVVSTCWRAAKLTFYTLCVYVLMEWLFFATKPSFLNNFEWYEQLIVLISAPLLLLPFVAVAVFLSCIIFAVFKAGFDRNWPIVLMLTPTSVAVGLTVLLIDNFTNTVFSFGIRKIDPPLSYLVLIATIIIFILWSRWFCRKLSKIQAGKIGSVLLIITLSSLAIASTLVLSKDLVDDVASTDKPTRFPNIIFFAADGIQASHLSIYGYNRETTPNLNELAGESLVVHNAVANAGRTTGSTTSMLAGKYASTTKVIFPPHVLTERHTFQHLPGILKKLGYKGIQETLRYYADAGDLNMVGGFDVANGRTLEIPTDVIPKNVLYKLYPTIVFLKKIKERLRERLLHLAGIESMSSVFDSVNPNSPANIYGISDQSRVDRAIEFIEKHQQPVFAYIHLMGSHCCFPSPKTRKFSKDHKKQTSHNFVDFYDDSILESDKLFGQLIEKLKSSSEYENSLIVYSSDHTRGWRTNKSVPLVIKFPNSEFPGNRFGVNQLLDVAPTIVDYLGMSVPTWMEGMSLLNSDSDSDRHIFTVDSVSRERFRTNTDSLSRLVGSGPPLYGVEVATLVACGRNFFLNIIDGNFVRQEFNYQGEPCSKKLENDEAKALIEQHLQERGFVLPYLH